MKHLMKNIFLLVLVSAFLSGAGCKQINREKSLDSEKTLIGVIRWDGWVGKKGEWKIGPILERTLGPERFHYRVPFFGKITSKDSVSIDGTTQEIMDREIEFAKDAGIDYWAYCYYPDGCGLELARKNHQTSKNANDINWCVILGPSFEFDSGQDYSKSLVADFARENYQKVLDGRPLIYLLHGSTFTRAGMDSLRSMTVRSGLKTPYVVVMEWSAEKAAEYCSKIGADALSCYAFLGKDNLPFNEFIPKASIAKWEEYSLKKEIVPWISTGWNARPRMESENPWTIYYADSTNCQDASPEDIKNFLVSGVEWTKSNPDKAKANTVLIYAWNEHDEGFGAICPTLGKDGKPNTERLDAVKEALR
jgi:hypothetical protein